MKVIGSLSWSHFGIGSEKMSYGKQELVLSPQEFGGEIVKECFRRDCSSSIKTQTVQIQVCPSYQRAQSDQYAEKDNQGIARQYSF